MTANGQEAFLKNVKAALGHTPDSPRDTSDLFVGKGLDRGKQDVERIRARNTKERLELLDKLVEEGKPLNLSVIPVKNKGSATSGILKLVEEKEPEWGDRKSVVMWKHPLLDRLNLQKALAKKDISVYITDLGDTITDAAELEERRQRIRGEVIDSFIGVTAADYCIAEGAALAMKTRASLGRSVSLVPSIHVAVIQLEQLVADVDELYTLLKYDEKEREEGLTNCFTMISGPSKTGDIELVMVHGAHGPRELHIFVITG
jgi:L-lactate dehydrogenase complex protein LldG